jgi:hypothetical protein
LVAAQSRSPCRWESGDRGAGRAGAPVPAVEFWDRDADVTALALLKARVIDGDPVAGDKALGRLRERLAAAQNPLMVAGPGIGTQAG